MTGRNGNGGSGRRDWRQALIADPANAAYLRLDGGARPEVTLGDAFLDQIMATEDPAELVRILAESRKDGRDASHRRPQLDSPSPSRPSQG